MNRINPERLMIGINEILTVSRIELEQKRSSEWRAILQLQDILNNRSTEPEVAAMARKRIRNFKELLARTERQLKDISQ